MKRFLSLIGSLLLLGQCVSAEQNRSSTKSERPNILYFYVDDLGWGSIGPNGQQLRRQQGRPSVRTPHLDQLARQGLNFTRGYGCFVCSPARSSQQTGFHQGHTFADRNDPDNAKKAMRTEDVTMGDALYAAGYTTGYWGKWGFGGSKEKVNPDIVNVQTLPTSHGYQHVLAELHHVRAHTFFQPTLWQAPASPGSLGGLQLVPNSMKPYRDCACFPEQPTLPNHVDYPEPAYCDDAYSLAALEFVRQQAENYHETGRPFFGLLAVQIPHAPFNEITQLPEWDKAYADDPHFDSLSAQSRQWAAMVTRIDAHFGNILHALEDPNDDGDTSDSVAEQTLVIFQSDNGGPAGPCLRELDSNGGLRGTKGTIYEGGIRVPLVMRWPGQINERSALKPGTRCDRVVDVTDLLPTFCDLANAPRPLGIDGVSIAPWLRGEKYQREREFIIHEARGSASIIRRNQKLVRRADGSLALFDLKEDPAETNNLAAKDPELARELERSLLDERVTEPKGFAVTYHRFTGGIDADVSKAGNWSDYRYANDGITYQLVDGAPETSWIANIGTVRDASTTAIASHDLQVLALAVAGDAKSKLTSTLEVDPNVQVGGRNEVRIGSNGTLLVDGGTVSSRRWIEIKEGGTLQGGGLLRGDVFNAGQVVIRRSGSFQIAGDYRQTEAGTIVASLDPQTPRLQISGTAGLDGPLQIQAMSDDTLSINEPITLLTAEKVKGRFTNADDYVISSNGLQFRIEYHATKVTVTLIN